MQVGLPSEENYPEGPPTEESAATNQGQFSFAITAKSPWAPCSRKRIRLAHGSARYLNLAALVDPHWGHGTAVRARRLHVRPQAADTSASGRPASASSSPAGDSPAPAAQPGSPGTTPSRCSLCSPHASRLTAGQQRCDDLSADVCNNEAPRPPCRGLRHSTGAQWLIARPWLPQLPAVASSRPSRYEPVSKLEFVVAIKWPATVLVLALVGLIAAKRNPGRLAGLAHWLRNRNFRVNP